MIASQVNFLGIFAKSVDFNIFQKYNANCGENFVINTYNFKICFGAMSERRDKKADLLMHMNGSEGSKVQSRKVAMNCRSAAFFGAYVGVHHLL